MYYETKIRGGQPDAFEFEAHLNGYVSMPTEDPEMVAMLRFPNESYTIAHEIP